VRPPESPQIPAIGTLLNAIRSVLSTAYRRSALAIFGAHVLGPITHPDDDADRQCEWMYPRGGLFREVAAVGEQVDAGRGFEIGASSLRWFRCSLSICSQCCVHSCVDPTGGRAVHLDVLETIASSRSTAVRTRRTSLIGRSNEFAHSCPCSDLSTSSVTALGRVRQPSGPGRLSTKIRRVVIAGYNGTSVATAGRIPRQESK